jgi:diguanylate cyclase (GGDEF)-like protein
MAVLLIGLLGVLDYVTGNEIAFSLFYLIPILLATLAVDQNLGVLTSFLSALTLLAAQIAIGRTSSQPSLDFLNTVIRTVLFSFFAFLVDALHKSQREQRLVARTDFVTGAVSARYFTELLQMEIERMGRYANPFTVVFIDIDNFKQVNNLFGHQAGDSALRFLTDELKSQLRKTDIVARVGGDEFALLLPHLQQKDAEVILPKVRAALGEAMKQRNLPLTFSMGAVTCLTAPYAAEQMISLADELMYTVKNTTKNDIRYMTVEDQVISS